MSDYVQKTATRDANRGDGPRDVRNEPSQTQERYNAAYYLAKKN